MSEEKKEQADDRMPVLSFLDAGKLHFRKAPDGPLQVTIEDDRSVLRLSVMRAFPVSDPERFIELRETDGDSVGMLRAISELDHDSRKLVVGALNERYMVPRIVDVKALQMEGRHHGMIFWKVTTERGEKEFYILSPRDSVQYVSRHRIRLTDVENNRYEISDVRKLPAHSRSLLKVFLLTE